jgi:hypothetical protein
MTHDIKIYVKYRMHIWNGRNAAKAISQEKHASLFGKMAVLLTKHCDSSFEFTVLQHRQSEGGVNNFATDAATVIKGRVTEEEQALQNSLGWIIKI